MTLAIFLSGRGTSALLIALGSCAAAAVCSDLGCEAFEDSTALLQYASQLRPSRQRKSGSEPAYISDFYPYSTVPAGDEAVAPEMSQMWPEQQAQSLLSSSVQQDQLTPGYEFATDWSGYAPAAAMPGYGFEGQQQGEPEASSMPSQAEVQYQYPQQSASPRSASLPASNAATGAQHQSPQWDGGLAALDLQQQQEQQPQSGTRPGPYPNVAMLPLQELSAGNALPSYTAVDSASSQQDQERGASPESYPNMLSSEQLLQSLPSPGGDSEFLPQERRSMQELLRKSEPAALGSTGSSESDLATSYGVHNPIQTGTPGMDLRGLTDLLHSLGPAKGNSDSASLDSLPALDSKTDLDRLQRLLNSAPVGRDNFNKILQSLGPSQDAQQSGSRQLASQVSDPSQRAGPGSVLNALPRAPTENGPGDELARFEGINSLPDSFTTRMSDSGPQNPIATSQGLKNALPSVASNNGAGVLEKLMQRFGQQHEALSGNDQESRPVIAPKFNPSQMLSQGSFEGITRPAEVEHPVRALESLDVFLRSNGLGRIAPLRPEPS